MEILKLNFDTAVNGEPRTLTVEVPYQAGIVATSEFCPTALLAGQVDIMAAVRGESLDRFMQLCHEQLRVMSRLDDAPTIFERHLGALTVAVGALAERAKPLKLGDLLTYLDCFALLLKASGMEPEEIRKIYPHVAQAMMEIYPDSIEDYAATLDKIKSINARESQPA